MEASIVKGLGEGRQLTTRPYALQIALEGLFCYFGLPTCLDRRPCPAEVNHRRSCL
ncbi:hypothetical protein LOY47_17410 [Pseudomonas brassicacearum]|jgi:hypothetical protein|uniref:Uncharacterized protein n=1 Tax=Pseudomonas brassicacearum (strain NFM421) TaxID=994484 RepID=F2KI42_PSEBN|nr:MULTISPECIES: hypothetical protein [Pseudomonas]AEA69558.1 Hypothetical protein PSEBR_cmegl63 [Pseudomonas brassicacearum subsp. brassicacearum NFM421]UVM42293.1 hypothetical protein LOY47_17410 [Pseudomonas brassicacearum]WLG65793.1 hypothetical protein PSH71_17400 [Pseudomonas brassicacearum]